MKIMNTNRVLILGSIISIFLLISIPTIYKVVINHKNSLIKVVEDKIINSAKKCYYEEKCTDDKITLKELYDLKYLDRVSDPISREYYNDQSYIEVNDDEFRFVVVE